MRHAWEEVRAVDTGQYLGAESWMQIMARRNHWLYGRAHSPSGMFLQRTGQSTTSDTVFWEGTTYWRAAHPTLNFSARMNIAAGGSSGARLQYYAADMTWKNIDSDTTTGDAWFNATENSTYNLTTMGIDDDLPADGYLRLRFIVDGTGGASTASVYRAFMSGTTGFTAWAAMADFADTDVPTAAQLNAIRTSQMHLLDCAERPNLSQHCSTYAHTQDDAYQCMVRFSFRYDGRNRLYLYLYTDGLDNAGEHVLVYICDEKYPSSGDRLNSGTAIGDYSSSEINQGYNYDLSDYSLTVGNYYQIEIGITNVAVGTSAYPTLGIAGAVLADTGSPTRTNKPGTFAEGAVLTHTHLNTICDDLEQMYSGTAGPESPIYSEHWISTHQPKSFGTITITASRIRLAHTWRWLRYASDGGVALYVTAGTDLVTLPSTDSEPALYDLENVSGLEYGMEYYIEDGDGTSILFAFEDYEA